MHFYFLFKTLDKKIEMNPKEVISSSPCVTRYFPNPMFSRKVIPYFVFYHMLSIFQTASGGSGACPAFVIRYFDVLFRATSTLISYAHALSIKPFFFSWIFMTGFIFERVSAVGECLDLSCMTPTRPQGYVLVGKT